MQIRQAHLTSCVGCRGGGLNLADPGTEKIELGLDGAQLIHGKADPRFGSVVGDSEIDDLPAGGTHTGRPAPPPVGLLRLRLLSLPRPEDGNDHQSHTDDTDSRENNIDRNREDHRSSVNQWWPFRIARMR